MNWDLADVLVGSIGALATLILTVYLHRRDRRESARSGAILELLSDLQAGSRRDELVRSLRDERDPHYLEELAADAQALSPAAAVEAMKAYHCNPMVKLPRHEWPGDRVAIAVLDGLGERYPNQEILPGGLGELAAFAELCGSHKVSREPIVDLIIEAMQAGSVFSDTELMRFLRSGGHGNLDLAPSLLRRLDVRGLDLHPWAAGNVVFACTRAFAWHCDGSGGATDPLRIETAEVLASLLVRNRLHDIATWDDEGQLSVPAAMCAASILSAYSHVAEIGVYRTSELIWRLSKMLKGFDSDFQGEPREELLAAFERLRVKVRENEADPDTHMRLAFLGQEVERLAWSPTLEALLASQLQRQPPGYEELNG